MDFEQLERSTLDNVDYLMNALNIDQVPKITEIEEVEILGEDKKYTPKEHVKCTISYGRLQVEDTEDFRKREILNKIHKRMEKYIENDPDTWKTTNFHYCPHYILEMNKENLEMFVADVYPIAPTGEEWKFGMCLISILEDHILHPLNKTEEIIIFDGCEWVVYGMPVKLFTYYDEGLINCGNDAVETISDSEVEEIILKNRNENEIRRLREDEFNNRPIDTSIKNKLGICGVSCR